MATGIAWRSQVMTPLSKCQLNLQASGTHPADGEVLHSLRLNFPPRWLRSHIQFNLRKVEFLCLSLWTKFFSFFFMDKVFTPSIYIMSFFQDGCRELYFLSKQKEKLEEVKQWGTGIPSYVAESELDPDPCSGCQNACFPAPNRRVLQDSDACCKNITWRFWEEKQMSITRSPAPGFMSSLVLFVLESVFKCHQPVIYRNKTH